MFLPSTHMLSEPWLQKLRVAWEKHLAAGTGFEGGGCQIRSQLLKNLACFVCVSENSAAVS